MIERVYSQESWNQLTLEHPPYSFLQGAGYWEYCNSKKTPVWALVMKNDQDNIISYCLAYAVVAKRGSFLCVSHGPVFFGSDFEPHLFDQWSMYLTDLAKKEKYSCLRIAPAWKNEIDIPKGFRAAPTHLHAENTVRVNTTWDDQKLLSLMRKSTRSLVKKSIQQEKELVLQVREPSEISEEMYQLYIDTTIRGGFVGVLHKDMNAEIEASKKHDSVYIVSIFHAEELLSWGYFVTCGKTAYYRHGANKLKKDFPAAYLAYWRYFQKARSLGCFQLDLWGISPKESRNHPWYSVSMFKTGFGGTNDTLAHAIDKPLHWRYYITWVIEYIRNKRRGY